MSSIDKAVEYRYLMITYILTYDDNNENALMLLTG